MKLSNKNKFKVKIIDNQVTPLDKCSILGNLAAFEN